MADGEETEGEEDEEESGRGHRQVDVRREETNDLHHSCTSFTFLY